MEIPEILAAFRINDGTYKREHVAAAVKLRDEIIPHLIRILEKLVSDPTPYLENDDYFDHVYAVILLGYFGTNQAHDVIVEAFSLPGMIPSQIFGDIVTEDLPVFLASEKYIVRRPKSTGPCQRYLVTFTSP